MDWIKDHVHDTVREIRRRSAVIPAKEDVAAFLSDNLYEKDIFIAVKIMTSSPFPERRLQAIKDIGHWAWSGGPPTAKFAGNYLPNLLGIASNPSTSLPIAKAAVQAIGNICCSSKDASLRSSTLGIVDSLCKLLDTRKEPEYQDLRHNIVSTLLVLSSDNNDNQKITIIYPNLKETLRRMIKDDWRGWKNNEAQRLYNFLGYDRQSDRRPEKLPE